MSWTIYKHTNLRNGKVYIGQTKKSKIEYRFNHGKGYTFRNPNGHFPSAIKKYGWDAFATEVIEKDIKTQKEANERETYWIRFYDSVENGYNGNYGGDAKGDVSADTRAKLSKNIKGRIRITNGKVEKNVFPDELDAYLSKGWVKKRLNDLSGSIFVNKNGVNKMIFSEQLDEYVKNGWSKGFYIVMTDEMKQARSMPGSLNPFFGKKHSTDTKRKLSEMRLGKNRDNASIEKQRQTILSDKKTWINNGTIEKWVPDSEVDSYYLLGYVKGRIPGRKRIDRQKRVIRVYDGKIFDSATEASLSFCNRISAVSNAILKKHKAGGHIWCYESDKDSIPELIQYFKNHR